LINLFVKKGEEHKAYEVFAEMKKHGVPPDEITIQSLVDLHVSKDLFKEAKLLMESYKIAPSFQEDIMDLHNYSHGTAYMGIRQILETGKMDKLCVITGIGHHSPELFAMKSFVKDKIRAYHPQYICEEVDGNPGRLNIIIKNS